MKNRAPLISVIMSVKNCEATVKLAVLSIMDQSVNDWEFIIFDDGSTDQTKNILDTFHDERIHIYQDSKNLGLASRLNQAIQFSEGSYIARMDGDDISYSTRFETQLSFMENNPDVDLVGSQIIAFKDDGFPIGKIFSPYSHSHICKKPYSRFQIAHPTYFGRRDWFQKYLYNEKMLRTQDQEILLRSYRLSRFANVPEVLLGYRRDTPNLKKILANRLYFIRALYFEIAIQQQKPLISIFGVMNQLLKGMVDVFAISTRLDFRIMRQWANPLTDDELTEWRHVWNRINRDTEL